jgi:small subunit ribosomal protein S6
VFAPRSRVRSAPYRNAPSRDALLPLRVAMAASTTTYDLTLLLDSTADADRRKKILADAEALIGKHGTVAGSHDWGVRPTTFEINKHTAAEYHLIQFTAPEPRKLLEELDHVLPITDGILRYRIIKLKPGVGEVPNLKNEPTEAAAPSEDDFVDDDER